MTSDIPGNPHAFDDAVISLFRTLPELNNFNIVWTNLPLSEPLLMKGELPPSRINSLSIYAPDSVPHSIDLSKSNANSDGSLEIKIEHSKEESSSNFLSTNNWEKGFLVMRNYLVPPGTKVVTPSIVKASDGTVVRPAQILTAGCPSTALSMKSNIFMKLKKLLITNSTCLILIRYTIGAKARMCILMLLAASLLAVVFYHLLFIAGGRSLRRLSSLFCSSKNQLFLATLEKGSTVSQPSTLHRCVCVIDYNKFILVFRFNENYCNLKVLVDANGHSRN